MILPLQAVVMLVPLGVIWVGGGCAIYYYGGRSLQKYGKNTNYNYFNTIAIALQKGSFFAFLYFIGIGSLMAFSPLSLSSEVFGPIVYYSLFFAPAIPIVLSTMLYVYSAFHNYVSVE